MNPFEKKPNKHSGDFGPVHSEKLRTDLESKSKFPNAESETWLVDAMSSTSVNVASGSQVAQPEQGVVHSTESDFKDWEAPNVQIVEVTDHFQSMAPTRENHMSGSWLAPVWEILKLLLIPASILSAFAVGIILLGVAQRSGWIKSASGSGQTNLVGATSEEASATSYICPMMCVPPTTQPGRCPVCAMELVPASSSSVAGPSHRIQIDPRSRRVAGIQTVTAKSQTLFREVRGVGEVSYNESKLKTLSAYVDGRIEELYADYTGFEVKKGDALALIYSPDLYAAQVEYVRMHDFSETATGGSNRSADSNRRLLGSSRQRLIELGMTEEQIKKLEDDKTPNSRLALCAPMSGTVIEKLAVAGQYVKAGTPVYKLADLSTVWLVLELFPEDARVIEIGQTVIATTQSMNGPPCEGKVEFVEPTVDPKMRTVGVRVEIDNGNGHLRPGEFVRATLKIPLLSRDGKAQETVVVPRNSLLSIGQTSLVYVEGNPGEFQLRHVKTGPTVSGQVAIFEGLSVGETVVAQSTFLLDAQMQLQGNPSLMDPDKAVTENTNDMELTESELEEIRIALEPLSEEDRKLAEAQVICPITVIRLGSMGMGTPVKVDVNGTPVFICCEGCRSELLANPEKSFKILKDYAAGRSSNPKPSVRTIRRCPNTEIATNGIAENGSSTDGIAEMIQSIVKFCIQERLLVILIAMLVVAMGWFAINSVPLDAIPNVGENQVIVLADWPGQSPKDVEDQLTYPLSVALQAVPGAKSVRGKSMFGFSFVQVTFEDSTDFYWARSRVAEQLLSLPTGKIPKGVTPVLGPDATGLGQIFYYVLEPPPGTDLAELRSKQDYVIKLALESVEGVAEVASIGGYVRQYQIEVDPDLLRYHRVPLQKLLDSVRAANTEVGAKTAETSGMEYLVRGKGFLGSGKTDEETIAQIENTVVQTQGGVPIRVGDLASVQTGPAFRQGALDLNGSEAVGGVVVMRYRENPRKVIENVKAKIASLEPELGGIKIRGIYDRTFLIDETVHTLNEALIQETLVTIAIVVLFLLHFRASLIIAISLPLAVLMAFIAMRVFGVDANIMSLAGIAIAIGTMVDMGIIILENTYDHLADWERQQEDAR